MVFALDYSRFSFNSVAFSESNGGIDASNVIGSISLTSLLVLVKFNLSDIRQSFVPFVSFGAGYINISGGNTVSFNSPGSFEYDPGMRTSFFNQFALGLSQNISEEFALMYQAQFGYTLSGDASAQYSQLKLGARVAL
jgi:hypothetical protein